MAFKIPFVPPENYHFPRILCHANLFGSTVKTGFKGDTVTMKEITGSRCDKTGKNF